MRKFKLVREYPGVLINEGEFITDKAGVYFPENGGNGINPKHVENYPEYWEEVKEEFPKIISFRNTANDVIFHICENGFYTCCSLDYKIGTFNKEHFLKESHFEIYQVAVSEIEVFTLGDKVEIIMNRPKYSKSTISRFELEANGCISVRVSEYCSVSLHDIKKAPEVLFVTEDGIEIYEGDDYYFIVEEDKAIIPTAWTLQRHKADANCEKFCPLGKVQFSSYKAAEKYIDENEPIYSKKQVREALEESYFRESYILDVPYCCADRFKENIFKQKLGL